MKKKYFIHLLRTVPFLPLIYFQGKKIKKEIIFLPEAKNPEGFVNANADKNFKIVFVGESSFAGVGVDFHENGFAGYFSRELSKLINRNILWKVYAEIGYNVAKIQEKIIPQIDETVCDLLVIGIGGNDTFEFTQPKPWRKTIQLLIDDVKQKFPETPILFAQLPTIETFPAFTKEMQFVLGNHKNLLADHLHHQVIKNTNTYFPTEKINVKEWLSKLEENQTILHFFSDGIHPSEVTYEWWAKESVAFLATMKINYS